VSGAASKPGPGAPRAARVFVTTYNRPWLLRLALRGWMRQTVTDFALTVADDGSSDGETPKVVAAAAAAAPFPIEHVWWAKEGFRRAGILNESVRRSAGEPLLVFTDGDCVPPAAFLERHLAVHAHRTFAVGGAVYLERDVELGEEEVDRGDHERLATFRDRWELKKRAWKSRWGVWRGQKRRPKVLGLNIGIDRALFEEVNGYDERFVGYGLEDSDLRDRVMATRPAPSVRILYGWNDTVHLWHLPATTARKRPNAAYYGTDRPTRCEHGLARPPSE
jgi:glycosyltransferase involved in cell wall biosynthesis